MWVEERLQLFVDRELHRSEWNRHGERGRVGNVEGGEALIGVDCPRTSKCGTELGLVYLHPLLDHCVCGEWIITNARRKRESVGCTVTREAADISPSKGFMNASLAMVADAPANAV